MISFLIVSPIVIVYLRFVYVQLWLTSAVIQSHLYTSIDLPLTFSLR